LRFQHGEFLGSPKRETIDVAGNAAGFVKSLGSSASACFAGHGNRMAKLICTGLEFNRSSIGDVTEDKGDEFGNLLSAPSGWASADSFLEIEKQSRQLIKVSCEFNGVDRTFWRQAPDRSVINICAEMDVRDFEDEKMSPRIHDGASHNNGERASLYESAGLEDGVIKRAIYLEVPPCGYRKPSSIYEC
jgi:hypothetical protein